jgi:NADH-quinone oxidoreductase subunit K
MISQGISALVLPLLSFAFQETVVTTSRFGAAWEKVQHPDLSKFLVIGALLFVIGVAGVLTRRNIIVIFMSIELILNAANLNFIAFSRYLQDTGNVNAVAGQIFAIFVIVVAAAEAAIGLGIVIALYRNKETIWVDEIDILKW